jgi:hypothetical protein
MSILPSKARKLTEQEVRYLRARNRESPLNAVEAAKAYGVGAETIRRVLRYETWASSGEGMTEAELAPAVKASQEKFLREHGDLVKDLPPTSITERLAADVAREKEKHPDAMLKELEGANPEFPELFEE